MWSGHWEYGVRRFGSRHKIISTLVATASVGASLVAGAGAASAAPLQGTPVTSVEGCTTPNPDRPNNVQPDEARPRTR
jgi:hypothetical protein